MSIIAPRLDVKARGFLIGKGMIKKNLLLILVFPPAFLCLGMASSPRSNPKVETHRLALRSVVEEALADIEFAYESKNLESFLKLLDEGFEGKARFQADLSSYFLILDKPHLHFVVDMVIADKNGVTVRLHWFRKGVTASLVTIKQQGLAQFLFKKYPEGLRLRRIGRDNPFF